MLTDRFAELVLVMVATIVAEGAGGAVQNLREKHPVWPSTMTGIMVGSVAALVTAAAMYVQWELLSR